MFTINENFLRLPQSYLFSTIAAKVERTRAQNPEASIISLGIGDVTLPIIPQAADAMHKAIDRLANADTFIGYGPEQGHLFLRKAIADNDYRKRGIDISPTDVFISDGAKSDIANLLDILGYDNTILLTDPVYPVYLDTNIMCGRSLSATEDRPRIHTVACNADNDFTPAPPTFPVDIIYLCYPNNPTGTSLSYTQLAAWVEYARDNRSLIIYDSAYEAYITDPETPHSIYEIPGSKEVAIEVRSFSKTAGFTSIRCGYTVVPESLSVNTTNERCKQVNLHTLWTRRQTTKFNGASYISQCGAQAIYTAEGNKAVRDNIKIYMNNAAEMRKTLNEAGMRLWGGINAPYVWLQTPEGFSSWQFFDRMLDEAKVVCTPGVGFGKEGEGFVRLTAFNSPQNTREALRRITSVIQHL